MLHFINVESQIQTYEQIIMKANKEEQREYDAVLVEIVNVMSIIDT